MAISLVATASTDSASGNPSITHGFTIASNDVIVGFVNVNGVGNTATDNNGSTAFTETTHGDQPPAGSAVMYIFHRVCGASEPSSYAFTLGSSDRSSIVLRQYRGVDSSVWDVAPSGSNISTDDTGGTTSTCSAITILTSGACGIVAMGDDFNPTTTTYSSINNSYGNVKSESGQQYQVTADKLGLSTGSTGTTVITSGSTVRTVQWQMALKPATSTIEQEGFRFGVDDGSESAHTWEAAQDTNITTADAVTKLLRLLANATDDPAAIAYKLKYQKNGSGGYGTVPIGATVTTSPPTAPTATVTTVGTAAASWTINRSTGSSGDLIVFVVAWDDSTTVSSVSLPAGVNSETAVSIAGPVASASTEMRMQAWYYIATGTWGSGTLTFTPSASETCRAVSFTIPAANFNASDPIGWANTAASAGTAETNVNSPTGTAESNDGDGRIYIAFGSDTDALTVPGSNWNTINNSTGGGVGLAVGSRDTLASNSESVAALTATIAGDSWASIAFVVKPKVTTNDLYISTSANITAGGEATTARLTAPSGKSTSDFVTGRRWDNENGTDTIDITTDDYTEVEWCLTLKSGLSGGDYFDFRVYNGDVALDTYTVTPRWTISSTLSATINQNTETDTAQAVTKRKQKTTGQNTETDTAQAVAKSKQKAITQNTETDAAQAVTARKVVTIGQVTETDLAQPVSQGQTIVEIGQSSETDTAQAVTHLKQRAITQNTETDTAQAVTKRKQKAITQNTETDAAQAVSVRKIVSIGQVSESDAAQAVTRLKQRAAAQVVESDAAQAVTHLKRKAIAQSTETDEAQAVTRRTGTLIGQVEETDLAQALFPMKRVTIAQASETDLALSVSVQKLLTIGQAVELDEAFAIVTVSESATSPKSRFFRRYVQRHGRGDKQRA